MIYKMFFNILSIFLIFIDLYHNQGNSWIYLFPCTETKNGKIKDL